MIKREREMMLGNSGTIIIRVSKLMPIILALVLLLTGLMITPVMAEIPKKIHGCDIGGELPPYSYYKRKNGQPTNEVTGFSVRYIEQILETKNIKSTIELLPWRRCKALVTKGDYALLLNASINPEREKNYLISKTYYTVKDVYFYSKRKPISQINNVGELRKHYICGEAGYNYINFGIRNEEVDTGTTSLPQAMEKLHAGHCDVVLARFEFAAGHRFTNGIDYTKSKDFGWGEIKGMTPLSFHIMVSRRLPYSKELIDLINQGIDHMVSSKKVDLLKQEFLL
jgi:polar amino acid transport system substrate-binding protein